MAAALPEGIAETALSTCRAMFEGLGQERLERAYARPSACSFLCGDQKYFDFMSKICFGISLFSARYLSHLRQYCSGCSVNEKTSEIHGIAGVGLGAALT